MSRSDLACHAVAAKAGLVPLSISILFVFLFHIPLGTNRNRITNMNKTGN
jgi:hypothetical protein